VSAAIKNNYAAARDEALGSAEILIRPDGRILVHNLTPAVAALLAELAPHDADMRLRAALPSPSAPSPRPHPLPPAPFPSP
jgi:hypothetical protein